MFEHYEPMSEISSSRDEKFVTVISEHDFVCAKERLPIALSTSVLAI